MEKNYINDLLVLYMYHELSSESALEAAQLIESFPEVRKRYEELRAAKSLLPKVRFNPSTNALNNILQYSTKTTLEAQL